MKELPPTLLAVDTETSGLDTRWDVILEAALIRLGHDLIIKDLGDVLTLSMRRPPFIVPAPQALIVTNASLEKLETAELSHLEGMQAMNAFIEASGPAITCGHNLLRYDEEIRRHNAQSCLLPPYVTQMPGSGRADTLVMAQAIACLDPGAISIPLIEGRRTFRLGELLKANGIDFADSDAHGAEYDCRAVIKLLALLKARAPAIYDHLMRMAMPRHAHRFLDEQTLFVVTSHYGAPEVALCTEIAANPANRNAVAVFDCSAGDPIDYVTLSVEGLMEALQAKPRIIKTLRMNAQPSIFPVDEGLMQGCRPDWYTIQARATAIATERTGFAARVAEAMRRLQVERPVSDHVEERLYTGFPNDLDRDLCQRFQGVSWDERAAIAFRLADVRLRTHALRLVFCHAPECLPDEVRADHEDWLRARLFATDCVPWRTIHHALFELSELREANRQYEDEEASEGVALITGVGKRRYGWRDPVLAKRHDEIELYLLGLAAGHA
ncbi:MAG: hypothetical protein K2X57_28820 [Xanthobacteraceae bacterium]|nr:hypothetical protein [Xanthobacteraceae bacterium]